MNESTNFFMILAHYKTRSQAVARIADRRGLCLTVDHSKNLFRTRQSNSNDNKSKPLTKFEVYSWNSFWRYVQSYAKYCGVTWPTFRKNYLCARSAFPLQSRVPNLKFLAQVLLEICSIVYTVYMPKN